VTASTRRPPVVDGTVGTALRWTTLAMQAALVGLAAYTLLRGQLGYTVNTLLMLSLALAPDLVRLRWGYRMNVVLALLIATAAFLHAVGSLGPYETVPMFDQVAHTVSAALVAGGGYVFAQVLDANSEQVHIPPRLRFVFVVIFATAFGVLWELLEFSTGLLSTVIGGEPLLSQYGLSDVVLDLLFDAIGAVFVGLWGTRFFDGVRRPLARRFDGFS